MGGLQVFNGNDHIVTRAVASIWLTACDRSAFAQKFACRHIAFAAMFYKPLPLKANARWWFRHVRSPCYAVF